MKFISPPSLFLLTYLLTIPTTSKPSQIDIWELIFCNLSFVILSALAKFAQVQAKHYSITICFMSSLLLRMLYHVLLCVYNCRVTKDGEEELRVQRRKAVAANHPWNDVRWRITGRRGVYKSTLHHTIHWNWTGFSTILTCELRGTTREPLALVSHDSWVHQLLIKFLTMQRIGWLVRNSSLEATILTKAVRSWLLTTVMLGVLICHV